MLLSCAWQGGGNAGAHRAGHLLLVPKLQRAPFVSVQCRGARRGIGLTGLQIRGRQARDELRLTACPPHHPPPPATPTGAEIWRHRDISLLPTHQHGDSSGRRCSRSHNREFAAEVTQGEHSCLRSQVLIQGSNLESAICHWQGAGWVREMQLETDHCLRRCAAPTLSVTAKGSLVGIVPSDRSHDFCACLTE